MFEYRAPVQDMLFLLCQQEDLRVDRQHNELLLNEAKKLAEQSWLPCNRIGDQQGCTLKNGKVQQAEPIKASFRHYADAGWTGLAMPERWGGQDQSEVLGSFVGEMLTSSNHALSMLPALTMSACRAIISHGSDKLRDIYLPPIITGHWTATMCMTEAHGGSDLGLVRSKAVPDGEAFRISGSKIFISYGSHNASDNIIHLVLARLPEASAGIKGLSLFLVPEKTENPKGQWQPDNAVVCTGIEEKMGIHASPTCSIRFEHSLDLLGRKVLGNQGASLRLFTKKIHLLCKGNLEHPHLTNFAQRLHGFAKEWPDLSMKVGMKAMQNHDEAGAASFDFLMYSGYVTLSYCRLETLNSALNSCNKKFS